jgi:AcrR family transcriptional regulator
MKCEAEIKELLISNAIRLIGEGGFEAATTKALALSGGDLPGVKMNEVYIYRFFNSKEGLYSAAFTALDQELYEAFQYGVDAVASFEGNAKVKLQEFFALAWKFLLQNEYHCRCYVRYYYSVYFKNSQSAHKTLFAKITEKISPLFREEADGQAILHSVFTSLLDFAIRVYNGDIEDNDINRPHVFNVLYCMMASYFNEAALAS